MTASETTSQEQAHSATENLELRQHLTSPEQESQTLRDSVEKALSNYFSHLEGQSVTDVYQMVLSEVEAPLLEVVMSYVKGNQTKASQILGLNRGTLRKKLKQYGLL
ncbi:DNA-binding transcriptional regulator Fis [Spartinivicinus poritis]|uniref:Putative Fis-like DNA-binding protein n=1 Tax=Spartinivicinus poritis TaxID=2994640 RepID=A0ABT5U4H1_9GAMM|nr:DNA-binding transcriptional regulator Fis [Spartinivicinus sp. A2-2]MDE1461253.1 DNA-binding transcriptional regulator Fis [Spartinivicinus sp. A2-2]